MEVLQSLRKCTGWLLRGGLIKPPRYCDIRLGATAAKCNNAVCRVKLTAALIRLALVLQSAGVLRCPPTIPLRRTSPWLATLLHPYSY